MVQISLSGMRPFIPNPSDWERWKGHKRRMFLFMRDGRWHRRDDIAEYVGTKGFTGRISDLRSMGYIIECSRTSEAGDTAYRIKEFVGSSTTNPNHCPTCTCGRTKETQRGLE